jgi:hypothetical protein
MNILDEYRRNARECQRMADGAGNTTDKASWLRLAASWMGMIKNDAKQPAANDARENTENTAGNTGMAWPAASDEDSNTSH